MTKYDKWCAVCRGRGGWDKRTYKLREKYAGDTKDTWMECVYCGRSNIVAKVK